MRVENPWIGSVPYKVGSGEIPDPFHHVRTQEGTVYKPGRGLSPDYNHAGALILNFPASRTEKQISVIYKLPNLCYLIKAAQMN